MIFETLFLGIHMGSKAHFSRWVCGVLFLRRTTDDVSALPTDEALSLPDTLPGLPVLVAGGLTISFIFGFTVVEKLRPRAIDPSIKLKSSAFGLTGACCCVRCSLLPIMKELRGDSTSSGSDLLRNWKRFNKNFVFVYCG